MEDFSTILLIIGAIVAGIIQELLKQSKARRKATTRPPAVHPPIEEATVCKTPTDVPPLRPTPFLAGEGLATTHTQAAHLRRTERPAVAAPTLTETEEREPIEATPEEVRRGILWSEILQRKY